MEIVITDAGRYAGEFPMEWSGLYNCASFAQLNAGKCERVFFLLFTEGGKVRLGIVCGLRSGRLLSPFSAPFGGFSVKGRVRLEFYYQAVELLRGFASVAGASEISVTLPPEFYNPEHVAKQLSALAGCGGRVEALDINYHYPLFRERDVVEYMTRKGAQNYRNASRCGFEIMHLCSDNEADVRRAYEVIRRNRQAHGYPLRMSLSDVLSTVPLAHTRFLLMTLDGEDVAAAQIQEVTARVAQVVYWGDAPGFAHLRPMNYFAAEVIKNARNRGYDVLDIGPSSADGVPSFGLCNFKESVGCVCSPKFRFVLTPETAVVQHITI